MPSTKKAFFVTYWANIRTKKSVVFNSIAYANFTSSVLSY